MYLADYHVHSTCSFDAHDSMIDMMKAGVARGMRAMCFTDHVDIFSEATMQIEDGRLPDSQRRQFAETRAAAPADFFLGLGLELGAPNHDPEYAKAIYAMPEYDFILGSLHDLRGHQDFYYLRYETAEQCHALYDLYIDELLEIAAIPCFDTMAHIGYCVRYMDLGGERVHMTIERYGDRIDTLLRTLIENGRGIEINCCDLVGGGGRGRILNEPVPNIPILRRYRELGGELITIGSDGHRTRASGLGVQEGYALLRELGFKYVAMYKKHVPEMIKI